jgi:hypothetical protein
VETSVLGLRYTVVHATGRIYHDLSVGQYVEFLERFGAHMGGTLPLEGNFVVRDSVVVQYRFHISLDHRMSNFGMLALGTESADVWEDLERGLVMRSVRHGGPSLGAGSASVQLRASGRAAQSFDPNVAARGVQGAGQSVPFASKLQASFGPRFDVGRIRAHTAPDTNDRLGSEAFAYGMNDIAFRDRNPSLSVVAHEVTHSFQQQSGLTPETTGRQRLEDQADAVSRRVESGQSAADLLAGLDADRGSAGSPSVQLKQADAPTADVDREGPASSEPTPTGAEPNADPMAAYDRYLGLAGLAPPANAAELGREALRLEGAVGRHRLKYISTHIELESLIKGGFVDALIEYVRLFNPMLHAVHGIELRSFMKHAPGSLIPYKTSIPYLRSPHRWQPAALSALAANGGDTSRSRPLVVVITPALDYNAALHHNARVTELVTDRRNLVIAIEGGATLASVSGPLREIAAKYGKGGKIQDVVFEGHGSPTGIELAGDVTFVDEVPGTEPPRGALRQAGIEMRQHRTNLDVEENPEQTRKFVTELLALLEPAKRGLFRKFTPRIVFNSCLVNAHELKLDPASTEPLGDQIIRAVRDKPNLVDVILELAGKGNVDVRAANASINPSSRLIDEGGRPTLQVLDDPAATGSKLDYIRKGGEPEGLMRAIVESWTPPSGDRQPPWLAAVAARVTQPVPNADPWTGDVIHAILKLVVERHASDPHALNELPGAAKALQYLAHVDNDDAEAVVKDVDETLVRFDKRALYKLLLESRHLERWHKGRKLLAELAGSE